MPIGPLQKPPDDFSVREYQRGFKDAARNPDKAEWKDANSEAWVGVGVQDAIAKKKPRTLTLGVAPTGRFADNYAAAYAGVKARIVNGYPRLVAPPQTPPEEYWSDQGALDAKAGADNRLGLELSVENEKEIIIISPKGEVSTAPLSQSSEYPDAQKLYKNASAISQNNGFDGSNMLTTLLLYRFLGDGEKKKKNRKRKGAQENAKR